MRHGKVSLKSLAVEVPAETKVRHVKVDGREVADVRQAGRRVEIELGASKTVGTGKALEIELSF